jgi:hypothetical protein
MSTARAKLSIFMRVVAVTRLLIVCFLLSV